MKNKIIISLIFIVPLTIYFILLSLHPDKTLELSAEAKAKGIPQVLIFSTPMCGECKKMIPVIEKAKLEYKDKVIISKIDATERNSSIQKLVSKYQVYVVPTCIYLDKNGKNITRSEGALSYEMFDKQIKNLLE